MEKLPAIPEEQEFDLLYSFLSNELPKLFNTPGMKPGRFGVSEEFDEGETIASFLIPYDAFNPKIPTAIQEFLCALQHDWVVCGSFDIHNPFNPDGTLNPSPRFTVTRKGAAGDLDVKLMQQRFGSSLRGSTE